MHHPDQFEIRYLEPESQPAPPQPSSCLVPGCACKDARILSLRRAAFFAALARRNGETADRVVPAERGWAFDWVLPVPAVAAGVAA